MSNNKRYKRITVSLTDAEFKTLEALANKDRRKVGAFASLVVIDYLEERARK